MALGLHHGRRCQKLLCAAQLLEINLIQTPQVADAILANGVLTHYDRPRYPFPASCCTANQFLAIGRDSIHGIGW